MSISYGPNLRKAWGGAQELRIAETRVRMYVGSGQTSDVFLSYMHCDESAALAVAGACDESGLDVYIDVFDDALAPEDPELDNILATTIRMTRSLIIVASEDTQGSWWVPWEVGGSTPLGKPRAIFIPSPNPPKGNGGGGQREG